MPCLSLKQFFHPAEHIAVSSDLSTRHEPISELFPRPATQAEWDRYRLTDDQVAFYHEHGYLFGVRMFDDRQIEQLRVELNELFDPRHPGHHLFYEYHSNESTNPDTVLFHALGAWRIMPGLHDILWNPAFVVPASQLLGGSVRFWHDQIFSKPPRHGGVVAWHQDYSYWTRTQPMAHLSCWIGLDDSSVDNGCLQYIPGSHRWPLLPITGLAGGMNSIRAVLDDSQWEQFQHPVAVEMPRGHGSFHHPLMVHGSHENRTDRPRRAVVINVFRDGVCSASNDELLAGVTPIPAGEKMQGQFFPLLYQPGK